MRLLKKQCPVSSTSASPRTRLPVSLSTVQSKDTDANGISEDDFSESDQVCDMLLPEGVRIEYAGAAATATATAPPARPKRAAAAAAGDELTTKKHNVTVKRGKRGPYGKRKSAKTALVKEEKKAKVAEAGTKKKALAASTEKYVSEAVSQLLPRLADRPAPAGTVWHERTQEAEAKSANLALSVKVYEAHKEFSAEIEKIAKQKAEWQAGRVAVEESAARREEWAGGRTDFREKYLEKILKKLEAKMLKDADAEI